MTIIARLEYQTLGMVIASSMLPGQEQASRVGVELFQLKTKLSLAVLSSPFIEEDWELQISR